MALSMLVGGADCGPSNPLQGLSKRFDQDRGIQQDQFGAGRAGSSRETFRSHHSSAIPDEDAARFFSSNLSPAPVLEAAYDLSTLRSALPPGPRASSQPSQPTISANWAADFTRQQPLITSHLSSASSSSQLSSYKEASLLKVHMQSSEVLPRGSAQWNNVFLARGVANVSQMPALSLHASPQPLMPSSSPISWETAFSNQEMHLTTTHHSDQSQAVRSIPRDADDLARTAGLLLEHIKDEQNPKFKNSQFLGLMQKLRDGDVIVEGNQMVENEGQIASVDIKGKGRAFEIPTTSSATPNTPATQPILTTFANTARQEINFQPRAVDPNVAYFEKENSDYTSYWENINAGPSRTRVSTNDLESWDRLQDDWDQFEATATGIKEVIQYQFQENNPYLLGDSFTTRHHLMHTNGRLSLSESVLQLEAAVQSDMGSGLAWFELGVKQQENERESKALQALHRALELDPSHLPTWLALAISHTNEGNRIEAYHAIRQWVNRNERYQVVSDQHPENINAPITERYGQLTQCLITMARSQKSGEVDADIQIALAVLLNSDEDYEKAQDCFRTALAVRPEDWLLYNRVGATMANSGQAEGALEYYYKALELNPGYIRARFNLGISCINLRRYEEAAQHILDALFLQENDGVKDPNGLNEKRGVTSRALWDSLKTTCMHMQRVDLATICDRQDLDGFKNNFLT